MRLLDGVRKMASRASDMSDPTNYLAWVRETNPEIAAQIEQRLRS